MVFQIALGCDQKNGSISFSAAAASQAPINATTIETCVTAIRHDGQARCTGNRWKAGLVAKTLGKRNRARRTIATRLSRDAAPENPSTLIAEPFRFSCSKVCSRVAKMDQALALDRDEFRAIGNRARSRPQQRHADPV